MEVTITLIICLSVVFIITLGIVSCTLRDKNFKARFDDRNKRLSRIIQEQRDELIKYREAIKNKSLKKTDEAIRSFSSCVKRINDDNVRLFQQFDKRLVSRPSYLSPEEKKHFKEYMQSCARGYTFISNMPNKIDLDFACVEDVDKALEFVGRDQWDSLYIKCPSEEEYANGQNTERNQ